MSGVALRKGTWTAAAVVVFAAGAAALAMIPHETHAVLANAPAHDVVSRAGDAEFEVSPSLAAGPDGTLAVVWVAMAGGHDDGGRYVGARVSQPKAGALGPLVRVTTATGNTRVSDATVVAMREADSSSAFLVTWLVAEPGHPGTVYSARITGDHVGSPVVVASNATRPRSASTASGLVFVAYASDHLMLATTHDGATFTNRQVADSPGDLASVCGDDHTALVTATDAKLGVFAYVAPIDPEGPANKSEVSSPGDHVSRTAPTCFITGQEAFIVYGITDRVREDAETNIADSLVFARSRDGGRAFVTRVVYRPSSRLLTPTISHEAASFTLLAIMGSAAGDAHASASVVMLTADGRSQNGLTRTVISPVTMVTSRDGAGSMGESLGVVQVDGTTWSAVTDNASGESHIALVRVL